MMAAVAVIFTIGIGLIANLWSLRRERKWREEQRRSRALPKDYVPSSWDYENKTW